MSDQFRFYGASDDLIEVDGALRDEYYADKNDQWSGVLEAPTGERLRVTAAYAFDGEWILGAGPVDEGPMPGWAISISPGGSGDVPAYSALLVINAPEGTTLIPAEAAS